MRKIFILGIILSLLLSSCSIDWNDEKNKKISELEKQIQNDTFKKKQECEKSIGNIKQELKDFKNVEGLKIVGDIELKEIFFSKNYNSCMFAYYYREEICGINSGNCGPKDYEYINEYKIQDYLTKKIMYDLPNGDTIDQFEAKIKELKGE